MVDVAVGDGIAGSRHERSQAADGSVRKKFCVSRPVHRSSPNSPGTPWKSDPRKRTTRLYVGGTDLTSSH
jgi:hypothetical protein